MQWLVPHQKHINHDDWESLPELTNSHGKRCVDSCAAQAWSISTIIDALRDLTLLDA
jgi:glycogen debranching enzyme